MDREQLRQKIRYVDEFNFIELSKEIYTFQQRENQLFNTFLNELNRPFPCFIPISAFKYHRVISGDFRDDIVFKSSGTSDTTRSQHHVRDNAWYLERSKEIFEQIYGDLSKYTILALLPHYLEKGDSSLVTMVSHFIHSSGSQDSGFYLHNHDTLYKKILDCKSKKNKTILWGVSYALVDFAEKYSMDFSDLIIMETGGMKGRGQEITREDLHHKLCAAFGVSAVHSEYGMTELLSQCYSQGHGIFNPSKTMKVVITEINDPFYILPHGKTGIINIIDLANIDSCSFIRTEDIGIKYEDGSFRVIGRVDHSEIRGCNLMVEEMG